MLIRFVQHTTDLHHLFPNKIPVLHVISCLMMPSYDVYGLRILPRGDLNAHVRSSKSKTLTT